MLAGYLHRRCTADTGLTPRIDLTGGGAVVRLNPRGAKLLNRRNRGLAANNLSARSSFRKVSQPLLCKPSREKAPRAVGLLSCVTAECPHVLLGVDARVLANTCRRIVDGIRDPRAR